MWFQTTNFELIHSDCLLYYYYIYIVISISSSGDHGRGPKVKFKFQEIKGGIFLESQGQGQWIPRSNPKDNVKYHIEKMKISQKSSKSKFKPEGLKIT